MKSSGHIYMVFYYVRQNFKKNFRIFLLRKTENYYEENSIGGLFIKRGVIFIVIDICREGALGAYRIISNTLWLITAIYIKE
jgi:hypothetical protein